jgi:hypothetical protein
MSILDKKGLPSLALVFGQILHGTGSFDTVLLRRHFAFTLYTYLYSMDKAQLKLLISLSLYRSSELNS